MTAYRKFELIIGSLALLGLLAYTFVHTGSLLARWVHPEPIGYAAAFGIELAIVWMSLRIGANRKTGKQTKWLVFVLALTLFISAIANIVEGFEAFRGESMTLANISRIDPIQAAVGLFATAFVCVVVFALSEVIGTDIDRVAKQARRDENKTETVEPEEDKPKPAKANGSNKDKVFSILENERDISQAEIVRQTGISKATVNKWFRAYQDEQIGERTTNGTH